MMLMLFLSLQNTALSQSINYEHIYTAKTGQIDKYLVRYIQTFDNPCIIVQTIAPGTGGEVIKTKEICSIEGKKIENEYADVDLKNGSFEDNMLLLEIGITPITPTGETIKICTISLLGDTPQEIQCKTK